MPCLWVAGASVPVKAADLHLTPSGVIERTPETVSAHTFTAISPLISPLYASSCHDMTYENPTAPSAAQVAPRCCALTTSVAFTGVGIEVPKSEGKLTLFAKRLAHMADADSRQRAVGSPGRREES